MEKRKAEQMEKRKQENTCPECGSNHVGGLVAAFYVVLNSESGPASDVTWESESEIGPERLCYDCDHEWSITG